MYVNKGGIVMTEEQLCIYRKRVQDYMTSREYFAGLFHEGFITEIEFHYLNLQLLMKYHLPEKSVFNQKDLK